MVRTLVLACCLVALLSVSIVTATTTTNDPIFYSHPDMAHTPVTDHEQEQVHEFVPHTEMQPPGSVIHHVEPAQHEYQQAEHHEQYQPQEHQDAYAQQQQQHQPEHNEYASSQHDQSPHDSYSQELQHQQPQHETIHDYRPAPEHHPEGVREAKAPEHNHVTLECESPNGFIHILDSSFGQGQGGYDLSSGVIHKGYCDTPLDITGSGCQGSAVCVIQISPTTAHNIDPCPGVFKRAVVTYKCTHDAIPDVVHPHDPIHSPPISLHEFLPPPSVIHTGFDGSGLPPALGEFFQRFFHNQQKTSFPFPDGEECEADAHKLCGGLLKNCIGDFGCVTECITDHAPHLSPACLNKHPCFPDIDQYCSHVPGGRNGILHCLTQNFNKLSHECVAIHPCLHDGTCQPIDYDDHVLAPTTPIFKNIPHYMGILKDARAAEEPHLAPDHNQFLHLVLPSVTREHGVQQQQQHPGFIQEHEQSYQQQQQEHHDAYTQQHQPEAQPEHHEYQTQSEHHEQPTHYTEHEQPSHYTEHQPEHLAESYAVEGADEDILNESDPTFDKATLGTGHFSHILLAAFPDHAVDVHTHGLPPSDGYEVSLWEVRHARNQMFDLNHFGQIFWIHEGLDSAHYCLTAHPTHTHQVISELCIHQSPDNGVTLSEEGHAQVWSFQGTQIHHISTGKCLEVQGIAHGVGKGNALHLVDCATHQTAQEWHWESGSLAEHNEHIFDEHHAQVMAHIAALQGHTNIDGTEHGDYIHQQTQAAHETAARAEHEQEQQHAAAANSELERLRAELHEAQVREAQEHESLLRAEHAAVAHEEGEIQHLEQEVHDLQEKEHSDHAQLEEEKHSLESERQELHHEEEKLHQEEQRLEHLEQEYNEHHQQTNSIEGQEHETTEEHHAGGGTHDPLTLPSEEPVHFFTPVTLILSVLFISVLAYVFRVYLCPFFVQRYSKGQTPSHYYSSHAY